MQLDLPKDEDSDMPSRAVEALENLGDRSETVLKGLLDLLKDDESFVRFSAAAALVNLGKSDPVIQPTLLQWIEQHVELPHLGLAIDVLWQTCV